MSRKPFLCLVVAVSCISGIISSSASAAGKPNLVPVSGRVLDAATEKPVAGALVGVYQSGLKAIKADSRGRFKVLGMPGDDRIIYYDGGNPLYRSDPSTYTTVNVPARGVSGVTLTLSKIQYGHGKVFQPSGMPLAGASVTIGGAYFTHAVTDSKGKFKIEAPNEQSKPGG
jgi:hypothetical protein